MLKINLKQLKSFQNISYKKIYFFSKKLILIGLLTSFFTNTLCFSNPTSNANISSNLTQTLKNRSLASGNQMDSIAEGVASGTQDLKIRMEVFEKPEDLAASELSKSIPKANQNTVTYVNTESAPEIHAKWGPFLKKIKFRYLEYPVQQLKRHIGQEVNYYRTDKTAMIVLSLLVGATSANYIFFADPLALSTKSFLIVCNAVLYSYLIVNIPRWQSILKKSEHLVEMIKNRRHQINSISESSQIFGNLGANFCFFMIYNFASQGIIHWNDLSQLFTDDILTLMLRNSVLGTLSTGVWDVTFRNWFLKGEITKRKLDILNWREAVVAGLLQSLVAAGIPAGEIALVASGTIGLAALGYYSDKAKPLRNGLSWVYNRGQIAVKTIASILNPSSGANMCAAYLGT